MGAPDKRSLSGKLPARTYASSVPRQLKRYYGRGDFHFVTFSCYRRLPLLGSARRRDLFLSALERVRKQYRFAVLGYVVMPEHVHLLVSEPQEKNLSVVIKALKQGIARRLAHAATSQTELFSPPPHFWQARFYDFNVFTDRKRVEKLRYMHRNPVKRGLVASPELWRWSSYRNYCYGETGPVNLNLVFPAKWTVRKVSLK